MFLPISLGPPTRSSGSAPPTESFLIAPEITPVADSSPSEMRLVRLPEASPTLRLLWGMAKLPRTDLTTALVCLRILLPVELPSVVVSDVSRP